MTRLHDNDIDERSGSLRPEEPGQELADITDESPAASPEAESPEAESPEAVVDPLVEPADASTSEAVSAPTGSEEVVDLFSSVDAEGSEPVDITGPRSVVDEIEGNPVVPPVDTAPILIVDDNTRNLTALEATLASRDVTIDRATSGEDALRHLLEREYAVILLDVQMPGIDGFETAAIIRSRDRSQHTPIIFLTAFDSSHQQAFTGYSVGAVDYLSKPYDPEILRAKVATFVELYRRREEARRQSSLLSESNRQLGERNTRIEALNRQISTMNQELERRVHHRTIELEEINAKLTDEIAERKRVEEEVRRLNTDLERRVQERTSDLEAFSYSLSHDLRAPLRSIDGFSKVLEEGISGRLNDEERNYLGRIRTACGRMYALIDDMLLLARATHGDMETREVDVTALATEIVEELRVAYQNHPVTFTVEPGLTIVGDPGLIRIAFFNLLDNAWKFTLRTSAPCVDIRREKKTNAIVIHDNGSGFNAEGATRLFSPFQRFHSAQEFSGTGIGLAIVHRIVNRHGGTITLESEEGKGTTIRIVIGEGVK